MSILGAIAAVINGEANAVVFHCSDGGLVQICGAGDHAVVVETDAHVPGWAINHYGLFTTTLENPPAEVAAAVQELGADGVEQVIDDWDE